MTRGAAWEEARRLVTAEGASYAEAAQAVGIPLATLQKRAATEGWQDQRVGKASFTASMRALKAAMLSNLQSKVAANEISGDDVIKQTAALARLESAFPEHRYANEGLTPAARRAVGAELLELLVNYLADKDPVVLEAFRPHLIPVAQAWEASCG